MSEHAAPSTTWRQTRPRHTADPVADDGRRRARRVVVVYASAATAWLVLTTLLADVLRRSTDVPPVLVAVVTGASFVAVTSLLLWQVMRRWTSRLPTAAEVERRGAEHRREVTSIGTGFLDGISHELRTPVTNILGFAETIRAHHRRLGPEHIEQFSDRLVANTTRLERLVADLLDLHPDGLEDHQAPETVHVEQLLRAAVTATGPRSQRLYVWSPAQWVQVERAGLERIVAELVGNVVRHTPADTVAWLQATTRDGELHLGIEDDGPGVDPDIIDQVSQAFVQGDEARRSHSPGLGIGLALAARYAEQLGGRLTISRPVRGGTRVEVVLPVGGVTQPRVL